jgi:TonB-linked SusC/RagA family outer membrane protein
MTCRLLFVAALSFFAVPILAQVTGVATSNGFAHIRTAPADDGAASSGLDRVIAVDLHDVPLAMAIARIADAGETRLSVDLSDRLLLDIHVSLSAGRITVREAIRRVLSGTGLELGSSAGQLVVARATPATRSGHNAPPSPVSIVGTIRDIETHEPLASVLVSLRGSTFHEFSNNAGRFTITGVPPGQYTLVTRRIGYVESARAISVPDTGTLTIDVALNKSTRMLDQVVTTATGNEYVVESGNMIGTIKADSLMAQAPITQLSDVLNARVPGLDVFSNGGLLGASPEINIRGQNSYTLSNQPLLYVDGARVDNSPAGVPAFGLSGTSSGRFNDIMPDDIETIEVVKGPSASTLYGTDAANGVILITTKRGNSGHPQWHVAAEQGELQTSSNRFLAPYFAWGHAAGAPPTPMSCPLTLVGSGVCTQDSVMSFSPLKDPNTTPLSTGTHQDLAAQVSGGGTTRYFVSADYQSDGGILKLPAADRPIIKAIRGGLGLGPDQTNPNDLVKYSARSNLTTSFGPTADVTVATSVLQQDDRIPTSNLLLYGTAYGTGLRDSSAGWYFNQRPGYAFLTHNGESITHFTGSVTGDWRPIQWLVGRLTTGADFASTATNQLTRSGEVPIQPQGSRVNAKLNTTVYSANTNLSATFGGSDAIQTRTSVGADYTRTVMLSNAVEATQLPNGQTDVNGLTGFQVATENTSQTVVAGLYVEELLTIADRYFLTAGGRDDGSSTFGSHFNTLFYPRFGASWLLSNEPFFPRIGAINSLRLRAAYGWSGVQPPPNAKLTTEQYQLGYLNGIPTPGSLLSVLGNPTIRPELQKEFETGADADLVGRRVHLEASYYDKRSANAITSLVEPTSLGGLNEIINLGSVRNWGYEGLVSVVPISERVLQWTISANASINHNQIVTLGQIPSTPVGGLPILRQGYPMFSYFERPYSYKDLNGDGIIEPNEVTIDSGYKFMGSSYPKGQLTLATAFTFFGGNLTLSAQIDRRFGATILENNLANQCIAGLCRGAVDRRDGLADQARTVAASQYFDYQGFYQSLDFTRLREVSISYLLPQVVAHTVHSREVRVTLSGRNLWLWSKFVGGDPETNGAPPGITAPLTSPYYDGGAIPPLQYWILRVAVNF